MALLSILTGVVPQRTIFENSKGIQLLVVDVTMNITPTFSAEVTQHPVEDGPDVSDHIRVKNVTISMEGIASETPLTLEESARGLITSAAGAVGSRIGGTLGGEIGSVAGGLGANILIKAQNKAEAIRDALIELLNERKVFNIAAPSLKKEYANNFVITSLTFPKDSATGRAVRFSAQLQQIQIVESQTVKLGKLQASVFASGGGKSNIGKQSTKIADEGKRKSLLKTLSKSIFSGNT